jgi:hypothetical protein
MGNHALQKEAVHSIRFFLIVLQNSVEFCVSDLSTLLAGVEKHQPATDVVEAGRAEGECGESARIDAEDFLEVQYDFVRRESRRKEAAEGVRGPRRPGLARPSGPR